jgi:hypothetical protein
MSKEIARLESKGLLAPRSARVIERDSLGEHVDYVIVLRSGLNNVPEGRYSYVHREDAIKAAEDWVAGIANPEGRNELTLASILARKAHDRAESAAKAPKEQPSHTPANASFFWELRGIADPTCFHFASKHLAIESLEVTYADEVAEQKFDIQWGHQNMSAVIGIKGIGCYTLTLKLAQTIFTTPIHLQRHRDL